MPDALPEKDPNLATLMIGPSDNTATNAWIGRLSVEAINARMQSLGFDHIRLFGTIPRLSQKDETPSPWKGSDAAATIVQDSSQGESTTLMPVWQPPPSAPAPGAGQDAAVLEGLGLRGGRQAVGERLQLGVQVKLGVAQQAGGAVTGVLHSGRLHVLRRAQVRVGTGLDLGQQLGAGVHLLDDGGGQKERGKRLG